MKTYSYATTALHEFMQQLSFDLKVPLINNKVELPETIGSGFIKSIFLEKDCCLRFYHINLNEEVLYKWFTDTRSDEPMFKLVFSLSSGEDIKRKPAITNRMPACVSENSATLYSADFSRKAIVPRGRWINRLVMVFTRRWLETNFTEANEQVSVLLGQRSSKFQPTVITQLISPVQHDLVQNLTVEISGDSFPLLHIKTMSLQIINNFLDGIVSNQVPCESPITLYPQMAEVEKKISEYYDKQMPNIAQLASEFNMSSATLKRHFKVVFGKSIYQYYLEKKMAVGKDLICVDHKTVSEVAYILGYNKINSFSKVFKKYYGVLPREMNPLRSIA